MRSRSRPSAPHRSPLLLYLLAASVPLLIYARTATFDFVHADDADLIAGNQAFLSDLRNLPDAFRRSYFEVAGELTAAKTYYRPAAIASFMLDAAMGGADPRYYHATNVVLHAGVTCLVLALAIAWGAPRGPALVAALVFAVHPVNAQAVAWIAGRNDLLLAVFGLVSLLAFAGLKADADGRREFAAAVHVIAFALALFSKETGIVFPLLAVLHQRLLTRGRLTRLHWIVLAGDAALVVLWAVLRARALDGMPSELAPGTFRVALMNAPQLLVHVRKMVLPIGLNVAPGVQERDVLLGAAVAVVLTLVLMRYVAGRFRTLMGAWVLLFLVPTLAVPAMPAYEHRVYLPLAGVAICLAVAAAPLTVPSRASLGFAAAGVLVVTLATLTSTRLAVFHDPFAYWTDAARDPLFGGLAHVNLGQLHERAGRLPAARREYLAALERDPNTPKAHNNLGVVLMALDEPDLATMHFKEEAARHPWNADAWFNLGLAAEVRGDTAAARRYYERAAAANPAYTPAREKLRGRE